MFSYLKNYLPNIFNYFFLTLNRDIHRHATRNSNNFYVPNYRYNFSRSMIKYKGAVVWNELPNELQTISLLSIFKRNYKSYLIILNLQFVTDCFTS